MIYTYINIYCYKYTFVSKFIYVCFYSYIYPYVDILICSLLYIMY